MSRAKQLATVVLVGLLAGLAGGVLGVWISERGKHVQKSMDVVVAKRFEAIGSNGTVRARFGVESGDIPTLILFGPDGTKRLWIGLDNVDEPLIMMNDTKGDLRASLGHETSDTASVEDDDWSLSFRVPANANYVAEFGMIRSYPSRKHKGVAGVRDELGHWFSMQPR